MKINLIEFAEYFRANVTYQTGIARYKIEELMQKEDLYGSFKKLQGAKPSNEDCEHFKALTTKRMRGINDLLASGYTLTSIKKYSIWGGE